MALTVPALLVERSAAHGDEIVARKKERGIWRAVTWSQLETHVRTVVAGLRGTGFLAGETACVLAETRPETVDVDLGILSAGGVSGLFHPSTEAIALGDALRQCDCRVLFVENEEQLDKALLVRERCPELRRIVVFDMKGLRDFADPMCESLQGFLARSGDDRIAECAPDQPAVLLLPHCRVLTHGDAMHMVEHARTLLRPSAGDERLALLPMSDVIERVLGLYMSLDARAVSNYLESPDTVIENLQELQPTILGADTQTWRMLHGRATAAADGATRLQRSLYRWAVASGGPLARLLVLNAVRRELGLRRLRHAYIGAAALPPEIEQWAAALGITIQQINGQANQGVAVDARYRALMEEAYGT